MASVALRNARSVQNKYKHLKQFMAWECCVHPSHSCFMRRGIFRNRIGVHSPKSSTKRDTQRPTQSLHVLRVGGDSYDTHSTTHPVAWEWEAGLVITTSVSDLCQTHRYAHVCIAFNRALRARQAHRLPSLARSCITEDLQANS